MKQYLWKDIKDRFPLLDYEIESTRNLVKKKIGIQYLNKHANKILKSKEVSIADFRDFKERRRRKFNIIARFKDKLYIKVDNDFREWLNITVPKYFNSYNSFARKCNMSIDAFDSFRRKRRMIKGKNLIRVLTEMSRVTEVPFDLKDILYEISWTWRGKPIRIKNHIINPYTKECSRVISAIFHDGSIANDYRAYYINTNETLRKIVCENLFSLIGETKIKLREGKRMDFGKTFGKIIVGMFPEIDMYRKTRNYAVPKIYKNGSKELRIEWLKQAFDDEAGVAGRHIRLKLTRDMSYLPINIRSKIISNPEKCISFAPKLLLDTKDMLEKLGIIVGGPYFERNSPFIYRDKMGFLRVSYQWYISITHPDNLKRFYNTIGFSSISKRNKIRQIIDNTKQPHPPFGKGKEFYLKAMYNLENEIGFISSSELEKILDRNVITIRQWLTKFRRKGLIIKIENKGTCKYKLSHLGRVVLE